MAESPPPRWKVFVGSGVEAGEGTDDHVVVGLLDPGWRIEVEVEAVIA